MSSATIAGTATRGVSHGIAKCPAPVYDNSAILRKDHIHIMQITDYGNSYILWTGKYNPDDTRKPGHMPWDNTVRILLDSRCWVTNEETGETKEYNLITPCRTEWMYRSDVLWQQPNHEFCGICSDTEFMGGHVKTGDIITYGGDWRAANPIAGRYQRFEISIRHYPEAQHLENDEQVVEATMKCLPIIARTEVWSDDGKMRAITEYPVKTMNVQIERKRMQVDTGPVIFPDFSQSIDSEIKRLRFAFVCYNTNDVAEFILRVPTPVLRDGEEVASVVDYSEVRRIPVKNSFYCAGKL